MSFGHKEEKMDGEYSSGTLPRPGHREDGFTNISPVASYAPNGYGLYMAGNVWQWTWDWYRPDYSQELAAAGSVTRNPRGPTTPFDPSEPHQLKKVQRAASYLCTDQYCPGTAWEHGEKAKLVLERITSGFDASRTTSSGTAHAPGL